MEFWKILKKIIERVRKFFRDVDENGKRFGHNMQAQPWPDDLKSLEQPAEKFNTLLTAAKENEQTYGSRESGARFAKQSRFYKAIDNNERGLLVGDNGVLLIDDSSNDPYISDYTLICWYGDKISPIIKDVYKISGFEYNICNPDYKLIDSIVDYERKGVSYDAIRKILRNMPLGSKAIFKRYNRKARRFDRLTSSNRTNGQLDLQYNQAEADRTGVSGQAQGGISGVQKNKQLNGKKSKDDTIHLSADALEEELNASEIYRTSKDNNKNNLRIRRYLEENYPDYEVSFTDNKRTGEVKVNRSVDKSPADLSKILPPIFRASEGQSNQAA